MISDGHSSCVNLNALETAKEFGFHLLILPGRPTHPLQPLDKSLFKAFKQNYKEKIHEFLPDEVKKDKWTKLNIIKTATVIMKQVFIPVAQIRVTNPLNEKKNEKTETTMEKARETAEETGESAESEQKKPVIDTKVSGGEVREKKSQSKKGNKKTSKKKVETDHFEIREVIGHKE